MKKSFLLLLAIFLGSLTITAQENLTATKAMFISGVTNDEKNANKYGVYPVLLEWEAIGTPALFNVLRYDGENNLWTSCGYVPYNAETRRYTFIDKNEEARPNCVYNYKVISVNSKSNTLQESSEVQGYGALTALTYMDTYNESIIASHNKLTLMKKKYALQKLGKERILGDISGGVSYNAKVWGFYGLVIMDYNDYEEIKGWTLDGNTNIKANILANGKMMKTIVCNGMYPGSVCYDNIKIKKGKAKGGYYLIRRKGFPCESVVWDAIQSEVKHLYKEVEDDPKNNYKESSMKVANNVVDGEVFDDI